MLVEVVLEVTVLNEVVKMVEGLMIGVRWWCFRGGGDSGSDDSGSEW